MKEAVQVQVQVQRIIEQVGAERKFDAYMERIRPRMHEYMIRKDKGHTKAVANLEFVHEGRETASCYAAAAFLGKLDEDEGLKMLQELAKLQVRKEGHEKRGGFRWYREETEIDDSNAAFFILVPLVSLALAAPESIPAGHEAVLRGMFEEAIRWFAHECAHPKLFYPNKIISDGALLLGLSTLVNDGEGLQGAKSFFERWLSYTERRGWGWGENTSSGYGKVILDAFQLALLAWNGREPELERQIRARRDELLNYARFFGGREYVPSIRGYNFEGHVMKPSLTNFYAGVRCWEQEVTGNIVAFLLSLLLYNNLLPQGDVQLTEDPAKLSPSAPDLPVPRSRQEHIFDDAYAYSWIGANCRIGTVSCFPAMAGSYHWPTWGLGWQSMPVSFLVEGEQLSFLRFRVMEGGNERTHPAASYHGAYLSPALFSEDCLPEPETRCTQSGNIAIIHRSMSHLANSASEIADEWLVQRFEGAVHRIPASLTAEWTSTEITTHSVPQRIESGEAVWTVLEFPHCYAAVLSLSYIECGSNQAKLSDIETSEQGGDLLLTRRWYEGEERDLRQHRIDHGWVVVMIDDKPEREELEKRLQCIEITDRRMTDWELPRSDPFMIREIAVKAPDGVELSLRVDPYASAGASER
ncbi:hypothetical protein [Paenibacillus sp. HB172176]|uniref:hypothetical protein n=1 Tax=Paenibacillus sp. HB172176 TaxID=2493690 RepID=UPI00143BD032|nr:hypothetical protein [Paenibacillus sp. HB172176]